MQFPDETQLSPYAGLADKIRGGKSASQLEYESQPPAFTVTRRTEKVSLKGILGVVEAIGSLVSNEQFSVEIDGQIVGQLSMGESQAFEVSPGPHCIRIVTPVVCSRMIDVDVENGQRLRFSCRSKLTGIILQRDN